MARGGAIVEHGGAIVERGGTFVTRDRSAVACGGTVVIYEGVMFAAATFEGIMQAALKKVSVATVVMAFGWTVAAAVVAPGGIATAVMLAPGGEVAAAVTA